MTIMGIKRSVCWFYDACGSGGWDGVEDLGRGREGWSRVMVVVVGLLVPGGLEGNMGKNMENH